MSSSISSSSPSFIKERHSRNDSLEKRCTESNKEKIIDPTYTIAVITQKEKKWTAGRDASLSFTIFKPHTTLEVAQDTPTAPYGPLFFSEQPQPRGDQPSTATSSSDSGAGSVGGILHLREELRGFKDELKSTQRQLLQAQIRLTQMEHQPLSRFYTAALDQLARLDREAHEEATAMRYTAMALQASHDRLEVELRRVLGIGLTAEAVDAAALEASARHFIRANIGFRVEHVSEEPAALTAASKVAASAVEHDGIEESATTTSVSNEHSEG